MRFALIIILASLLRFVAADGAEGILSASGELPAVPAPYLTVANSGVRELKKGLDRQYRDAVETEGQLRTDLVTFINQPDPHSPELEEQIVTTRQQLKETVDEKSSLMRQNAALIQLITSQASARSIAASKPDSSPPVAQ